MHRLISMIHILCNITRYASLCAAGGVYVQSVLRKCVTNFRQLAERDIAVCIDRNWLRPDLYVLTMSTSQISTGLLITQLLN